MTERPSLKERILNFKQLVLNNKISSFLAVIALLSFLATIAAFAAIFPFDSSPETLIWLLSFDLVLFSALGIILARHAMNIWIEHKKGKVGSKLHVRLITVFITAATIPGILIAIVSTGFFYLVVQAWFSDRVKNAVEESYEVSQAYLLEHQQVIKASVDAMAIDLSAQIPLLSNQSSLFQKILDAQTHLRSLSDAIIFDDAGKIVARSGFSNALEFYPVTQNEIKKAQKGEIILWPNYQDRKRLPHLIYEDRIRALIKLESFGNMYLYVSKLVDSDILNHLRKAETAVEKFREVESFRRKLQYGITLFFVGFTFLLVSIAILYGIKFSRNLVTPIQRLITASDKVSQGKLGIQVTLPKRDDELKKLTLAFNTMIERLKVQRQDLIRSRHETELKRELMEKILSAVTSGVVSLDHQYQIITSNKAAEKLLHKTTKQLEHKNILKIIPALQPLFIALIESKAKLVEDQINMLSPAGTYVTFHVTLSSQELESSETGYVMTFDDISEILAAQKKNAWADVARRIAHEIKNPLTPIQLSAERLEKKYLGQIQDDEVKTFKLCLETIQKHVSSIGRMVNEFSNFAKMPDPKMKQEDLLALCKQAISLYKDSDKRIQIYFTPSEKLNETAVFVDAEQLNQVFSNLLINAIQAIQHHQGSGEIHISLALIKNFFHIQISDNGPGFPPEKINQLTEPYVTTKIKGTGLGLAIVKKIIEDHGGNLVLRNKILHNKGVETIEGAEVIITLPKFKK